MRGLKARPVGRPAKPDEREPARRLEGAPPDTSLVDHAAGPHHAASSKKDAADPRSATSAATPRSSASAQSRAASARGSSGSTAAKNAASAEARSSTSSRRRSRRSARSSARRSAGSAPATTSLRTSRARAAHLGPPSSPAASTRHLAVLAKPGGEGVRDPRVPKREHGSVLTLHAPRLITPDELTGIFDFPLVGGESLMDRHAEISLKKNSPDRNDPTSRSPRQEAVRFPDNWNVGRALETRSGFFACSWGDPVRARHGGPSKRVARREKAAKSCSSRSLRPVSTISGTCEWEERSRLSGSFQIPEVLLEGLDVFDHAQDDTGRHFPPLHDAR